MIKASGLTKVYRSKNLRDKKVAVDNLSFTVESGKVTGFLGPNGAGKSTAMRLMLELDHGGGTTLFDNKRLSSYAQPSKIVGMLLEAKAFHPTRTARNHLRVLADAGNIPLQRVDEVLEIVGLSSVAKKGPGKFSLGMSQRLGIAAALLGDPKYLILDEPANGLDPEGVAWLRQFIKDYAKSGKAVFVSSHLLSEISQMADNVVVIGKGKLIVDAPIEQLTSKSRRSSVYIRTANTLEFEKTLKDKKLGYERSDRGLNVLNTTTDSLGKMAFSAGQAVLELYKREASLEEVFLELTEESEEYVARGQEAKK